ncbi:hypothetical protein chiPu_0022935 [Chiloscyllium punctatum]|uniref:Uncharacterized protein n=1 Tax=Chiloscyllium punctatum TaxID=137246 RepID=A0A401T9D1_CHIPU|nr:hypothetical protein [Chiloscyllium punctatum]
MAITQKPSEGAREYRARTFEAFQAHSGIPDAERQNPAFIQLYKDGLGPTHQAVLRTGLAPYVSFTELENWAMSLDNQARATVAALSTPGPLVCCIQTSLTARSPSDAPETPTWEGAAPPRAGTTRVSTAACPPSAPLAPQRTRNPKQGTNHDSQPENLHKPHNPSPKPSPPTGISSVVDSCSSSYSYSPGVRTE